MNIAKIRNLFFALAIATIVGIGTFTPDVAFARQKIETVHVLQGSGDCVEWIQVDIYDDGSYELTVISQIGCD